MLLVFSKLFLIIICACSQSNATYDVFLGINKTWESTFEKQSPDGAAVLPPSKSAYQSFLIRVPQSAFFVMNFGTKILPPSSTSISANFCCCDIDALVCAPPTHNLFLPSEGRLCFSVLYSFFCRKNVFKVGCLETQV